MLYQYSKLQEGFTEEIQLDGRQDCHIDGIMFNKGMISKIVISVHNFDDKNSVHINFYIGNINIAAKVTYSDFVIEYFDLGQVKDQNLLLRKAEKFDYR